MSVEAARALVAAFSGDDAWRSAKAKLQRRDRYGRFAEMGGGFSFNLRLGNGDMRRVSGKIVGQSGEEDIDIEVSDSDTLPDGTYSVPSRKGEAVKAIISKDALKSVKKENVREVADDVFVDIAELKTAKKKKKPKQQKQEQEQEQGPKVSRNPFKRGDSRTPRTAVKNPKNADLAFADENGFLEQRTAPRGVEVTDPTTGEKIILNSQAKANTFVKNGGALSQVPDDFLMGAIEYNSKPRGRFSVIGEGGGVNGMTRMIDNVTGAYIGTKYETGESSPMFSSNRIGLNRRKYEEATNEIFAEIIAEVLGYEPMPMRLVKSKNGKGVALVTELAQNRWGSVDTPYSPDTWDDNDAVMADVASFAKMMMLDSLIGNEDRNPGNYMVKKLPSGKYELIPIDHSLAFDPGKAGKEIFSPDYMEELEAFRNRVRDQRLPSNVKPGEQSQYAEFIDAINDLIVDLANIDPDFLSSKINQIFNHLEAMFPGGELYSPKYRQAEIDRMLGAVTRRIAYLLGESPESVANLFMPPKKSSKQDDSWR